MKLPELKIEKSLKLEERYNIREDQAKEIIDGGIDFEDYVKRFESVKPEFIAKVLIDMRKEIKARFNLDTTKGEEEVLQNLNDKKISESASGALLIDISSGKKIDLKNYKEPENLDNEIKKIIRENKGASFNAIMGEVMKKFNGKVDPKKVSEIIKKEV